MVCSHFKQLLFPLLSLLLSWTCASPGLFPSTRTSRSRCVLRATGFSGPKHSGRIWKSCWSTCRVKVSVQKACAFNCVAAVLHSHEVLHVYTWSLLHDTLQPGVHRSSEKCWAWFIYIQHPWRKAWLEWVQLFIKSLTVFNTVGKNVIRLWILLPHNILGGTAFKSIVCATEEYRLTERLSASLRQTDRRTVTAASFI